jgi:hypothetical protein
VTQREDQIARLELRLKQLREHQARTARRQRHLSAQQERKDETRRKILVGAIVLTRVQQGELQESELRAWLGASLTRQEDRALFHL